MDGFIGPIQKPAAVTPTAKDSKRGKSGKEFSLVDTDPEAVEDQLENEEHHLDLPVGPARFDESGQRIDYTV